MRTDTAWKVSKCRVFSGPYFPVFSPNTRKCGWEKTLYLDTFHAVWTLPDTEQLKLKQQQNFGNPKLTRLPREIRKPQLGIWLLPDLVIYINVCITCTFSSCNTISCINTIVTVIFIWKTAFFATWIICIINCLIISIVLL